MILILVSRSNEKRVQTHETALILMKTISEPLKNQC